MTTPADLGRRVRRLRDPGPACYGRGCEWATVTDADAVAEYLDTDAFAEGRLRLDF